MKRLTWHQLHRQNLTPGQRIADSVAKAMGSWPFIIIQSAVIAVWIALNLFAWVKHWDPYPFILLNLLFSTQAAYAAPVIMMSQNRQAERDRFQAKADFDTNVKAEEEIERIQELLALMDEKLDRLQARLDEPRGE